MKPPPSQIVAAREKAIADDLRSHLPKRPPPPSHHVLIDELYNAMDATGHFKGKVSCSDLHDITNALNAKLDQRLAPHPDLAGVEVVSGEVMGRVREALMAFTHRRSRHFHVAMPGDMDRCADCGEDLRSLIHFRFGEGPNTDHERAKAALALLPTEEALGLLGRGQG